jgi:integrase
MIYKRGDSWHMDITVAGVRYRESLNTSDKREASSKEKDRIAAIKNGKAASKSGRDFARKPIVDAVQEYLEDRKLHTAARTQQLERERLKPVLKTFNKPLARVIAKDIADYQTRRRAEGVSNRTINMEVGVVRLLLKRAKVWNAIAEDVKMLPESGRTIAKVLTAEQKRRLFEIAASRDEWMVAYCAAVIAVSTTCRSVELKNLRWVDVDLEKQEIQVRRSKTEAGERHLPLNRDALIAFARLWQRAELLGSTAPEHYVFPTCQRAQVDPLKPQVTWRTAWRKLTAKADLPGFRFHDLRHQAITELAEKGISDATLMAMAGHMSRKMLEHYSHVRMDSKRKAVEGIASGLIEPLNLVPVSSVQ